MIHRWIQVCGTFRLTELNLRCSWLDAVTSPYEFIRLLAGLRLRAEIHKASPCLASLLWCMKKINRYSHMPGMWLCYVYEFSLLCRRRMNNLLGFDMTSLARHGIGKEWTPGWLWVKWRRYFVIHMLKLSILMSCADVTWKLVVIQRLCLLTVKMKRLEGVIRIDRVKHNL
jgi:hypothetical protein